MSLENGGSSMYAESSQFLIFVGISLVMALFFGVLNYLGYPPLVVRLFGGINPIIGVFLVSLLGISLFGFLISRGWFAIYKKGTPQSYLYATALAALLGVIAIIADFMTRKYPADINVLFPKSLLTYPVMGFVAEIIFQVLPITLALIVLTPLSKKVNQNNIIWIAILFASMFEPIFQTWSSGQYKLPLWFAAFEFIRIFLIILSQLAFFKWFDFTTMYWFRIVYYTFWHIGWGYLRLILLF